MSLKGRDWADITDDDEDVPSPPPAAVAAAKEEEEESSAQATATADTEDERIKMAKKRALREGEIIVESSGGSLEITEPCYNFEDLHLGKELLDGLYAMNYDTPSKIQAYSIPLILKEPRINFIGQGKSGTGKTATFCISMISSIDYTSNAMQAICIAPTRELAMQSFEVLKKIGQFVPGLKPLLIVPLKSNKDDPASHIQGDEVIRLLDHFNHAEIKGYNCAMATIGSLIKLVAPSQGKGPRKKSKPRLNLKSLKILVLDEADEMVAGTNVQDVKKIVQEAPQCQKVCFSATYSDMAKAQIDRLIASPKVKLLLKQSEEVVISSVEQYWIRCANEQGKFSALKDIYELLQVGQSIVFCNTRKAAHDLGRKLEEEGCLVGVMTGQLSTYDRDAMVERFRKGEVRILISSSVLGRGFDVPAVTLVVNFDLPKKKEIVKNRDVFVNDYEQYVHRVGRAGRWERRGVAINLLHDDTSMQDMLDFQKVLQTKWQEIPNVDDLAELQDRIEEFERDLALAKLQHQDEEALKQKEEAMEKPHLQKKD